MPSFQNLKTLLTPSNQLVYDSLNQKPKPGADGGYIRIKFAGHELKGSEFREFIVLRILETSVNRKLQVSGGRISPFYAGEIKKEARLPVICWAMVSMLSRLNR